MRPEKRDRRVRRTRQLIHEALVKLILEKPYAQITVQDILNRADVGRSTFYAHFRDKEDLFQHGFEGMLEALNQHFQAQAGPDAPLFPSLELFRHVAQNHSLYQALVRGQGVDLLFNHGQAALHRWIEQHLQRQTPAGRGPAVPIPVTAAYLTGGLILLLKWWLDNQMPYTPEQMDTYYRQMALPALAPPAK